MSDDASRSRKPGPLFYIGAGGLLLAMAVEAIAVIGRHLSAPLLGSIEIIQTAILLTACAAMLSATLGRSHATVHLLMDRLPAGPKHWLQCFASFLSALFFTGLAAGALWLTLEFWNAHEESELLHIPFRPLRVIAVLSIASIACVFWYRTLRAFVKRQDA